MRNPGGWEILVINVVGCRRERIGAIRGVTPRSYVHILDTPQSYIWTDAEISTHGHLLTTFIDFHMEKVFTQLEQSQWELTLYTRVIDLNLIYGITYGGRWSYIWSSVRLWDMVLGNDDLMSGTSHLPDFHDTIHGDIQDWSSAQALPACWQTSKRYLPMHSVKMGQG